MTIPPISSSGAIAGAAPITPPALDPKPAGTFQSIFSEAVDQVGKYQQTAKAATDRFLSGEDEDLHHVAIAGQQADLAFQLFLEVRNKVVSAYQEVMRMQI
ncbi:MAG: flagellar hook-basal body complex protein FliE [Bryobacteraceae bacterium]